jgi:hypothetical protein
VAGPPGSVVGRAAWGAAAAVRRGWECWAMVWTGFRAGRRGETPV